jgi:hypothetical protein
MRAFFQYSLLLACGKARGCCQVELETAVRCAGACRTRLFLWGRALFEPPVSSAELVGAASPGVAMACWWCARAVEGGGAIGLFFKSFRALAASPIGVAEADRG